MKRTGLYLLTAALIAALAGCGGGNEGNAGGNGQANPDAAKAKAVRPGDAGPAENAANPGEASAGTSAQAASRGHGIRVPGLDHDGLFAPLELNERPETAGLGDFGYGTMGLAQRWDGRNRRGTPLAE